MHLARGEADAAVQALRQALSAAEPRLDFDDPELAELRATLATALLAASPASAAEANALLTAARDVYKDLGAGFAREYAAASAKIHLLTRK